MSTRIYTLSNAVTMGEWCDWQVNLVS